MRNAATTAVPVALALAGGMIAPTTEEPRSRVRPARFSALKAGAPQLSPAEQALAEENCPLGLPAKDPEWDHGPTRLIAREGYALEHLSADKVPLWVCEHVVPAELTGNAVRRDKFAPDPKLAKGSRAELADYKGSGFDRGHLAPAGNQSKSQRLRDETFFLSNMSPQVGRGFNQDIWRILEDTTRDWVRDGRVESAWIVTGGFFFDPDEENTATADGFVEIKTIGKGVVSVPTHFYKIVVGQAAGGELKVVAFVMENRRHARPFDFEQFIESVDWIEERTGLDFMPGLDAAMEQRLEREPGQLF